MVFPIHQQTAEPSASAVSSDFLSLPEDIQERIFSLTRVSDMLYGRILSDAVNMIRELRLQVPAINAAFKKVHVLSSTNQIPFVSGLSCCSCSSDTLPGISTEYLLYIIRNSNRLRFVLLPNTDGATFMTELARFQNIRHTDGPAYRMERALINQFQASLLAISPDSGPLSFDTSYLHGIQQLSYTDGPGAEISPFLTSLYAIYVRNPRSETVVKLTEHGGRIGEVWFQDVDENVTEVVKEFLLTRSSQLSSVAVFLQFSHEHQDPSKMEQVLLDLFSAFIAQPEDQLEELKTIKLGPITNAGSGRFRLLINASLRFRIRFSFDTIDPLGTCYPSTETTLVENPKPRSLSFRHRYLLEEPETSDFPFCVKEIVMEDLDAVEDCILKEMCCPRAAVGKTNFVLDSMRTSCPPLILQKQSVRARFAQFSSITHLSVRIWSKGSLKAAHTILLGILWFLQHFPNSIHLEITKEFVTFPQMIDERKKNHLWWEPFRNVERLMIRHMIRPVTFEGARDRVMTVCDYEFAKALPDFIYFLVRAFPKLRQLSMESSGGKMTCHSTSSRRREVHEALDSAISVLDLYETINKHVCVSTVKAQLYLWKKHELQS